MACTFSTSERQKSGPNSRPTQKIMEFFRVPPSGPSLDCSRDAQRPVIVVKNQAIEMGLFEARIPLKLLWFFISLDHQAELAMKAVYQHIAYFQALWYTSMHGVYMYVDMCIYIYTYHIHICTYIYIYKYISIIT